MTTVNTIPTTYPRVTPHLAIEGAAEAVEFYKSLLANRRALELTSNPAEQAVLERRLAWA